MCNQVAWSCSECTRVLGEDAAELPSQEYFLSYFNLSQDQFRVWVGLYFS